ncbi:MAG: phosphate acyltransferase PlsX [Pseudomonadota bacterium]
MTGQSIISIDAMGGDKGPAPVLGGLARAVRKLPELRFLVHGDAAEITRILRRRSYAALRERCEVIGTEDVVAMGDKPSRAIRERRGSSMWASLEAVKAGRARVAVSCGNTGALLAMAVLILRKAPGIDRPAIAVHWPSAAPHGYNTVLDVGADLRAGPRALTQYAVMGAEYARLSFGLARPRIGFLNIGTEPTKGTVDLHLAAETVAAVAEREPDMLAAAGFVEGTDISGADVDVVVTDGFTGNIALKTAEGTAEFIRTGLREAFEYSILSRIGALFALTSLRRFRKRIDPRRVNGGVFLGLNGTVVKSHGGADAVGVEAAVKLAAKLAAGDFAAGLERQLARVDLSALPHGHGHGHGAGQEPDEGPRIGTIADDRPRNRPPAYPPGTEPAAQTGETASTTLGRRS